MGYSPWGHKESDTAEPLTALQRQEVRGAVQVATETLLSVLGLHVSAAVLASLPTQGLAWKRPVAMRQLMDSLGSGENLNMIHRYFSFTTSLPASLLSLPAWPHLLSFPRVFLLAWRYVSEG